MSITDELRKWAHGFNGPWRRNEEMLLAIADRIDAEHEKAEQDLIDANNQMEQLCECSIRLPVDADGVPIHVGDVMESNGANSLFGQASFEVRAMRYDEGGWEVYDRLGDRYMPSLLRHYHAPTVEDVLIKMLEKAVGYSDAHTTVALNAIAEYAAKLRLAEEES